jgi:acyl dehydratase
MTNPVTQGRRFFEDLAVGERVALGATTVSKEMIVAFARQYDPLPFHLDEKAAKASLLGGLAASGWQTGALTLRRLVDVWLSTIASAGMIGWTNLKWRAPVMAGDTIGGSATLAGLEPFEANPALGVMQIDLSVTNTKGATVMSLRLANLVERRSPRS